MTCAQSNPCRWQHRRNTNSSSKSFDMRAWFGFIISPLSENTRYTGAELAGTHRKHSSNRLVLHQLEHLVQVQLCSINGIEVYCQNLSWRFVS